MLQGIFAAVYISIAARLPHTAPLIVKSVFNERVMYSEFPWINSFLYSIKNMLFSLALIIAITSTSLIISVIKGLVCSKNF
jgi:hypothetical protein